MLSKQEHETCLSAIFLEKWGFLNNYDRRDIKKEFAPTLHGKLNNVSAGRFFINLFSEKDILEIFKPKIEEKVFKNIKIMAAFGVALFSESNSQLVYGNKDGVYTFIYNMNDKWSSDMKGRLVLVDDAALRSNFDEGDFEATYIDPKPNAGTIIYPEQSFFEEAHNRLFNALKISITLKFKEIE